jgi:hypothetical protein
MPDYVDARSIHAAVDVTFFAVEDVPLRARSVLLFSFARLEISHLASLAAVRILGHHGNKLEVNARRAVGELLCRTPADLFLVVAAAVVGTLPSPQDILQGLRNYILQRRFSLFRRPKTV